MTIEELRAKLEKLGEDASARDQKVADSQTALQHLGDVTLDEGTKVQAALAHQQQEVSSAQSAADASVAAAQAATDQFNSDLDDIIAAATALKV